MGAKGYLYFGNDTLLVLWFLIRVSKNLNNVFGGWTIIKNQVTSGPVFEYRPRNEVAELCI